MTDALDGALARMLKAETKFGAVFDHTVDKLLVATTLILVSPKLGKEIIYPTVAILSREVFVTALRARMAAVGRSSSVAVGLLGKIKTACQLVAITVILYARSEPSTELYKWAVKGFWAAAGMGILSALGMVMNAERALLAPQDDATPAAWK